MANKVNKFRLFFVSILMLMMLPIGCITVWVAVNMGQSPLVRILIGAIGPVWSVLTILYVLFFTDYRSQWQELLKGVEQRKFERAIEHFPEYMALRGEFPLSIKKHESYCLKHGIEIEKMVKLALDESHEEWAEREAFRIESKAEHNVAQTNTASRSHI